MKNSLRNRTRAGEAPYKKRLKKGFTPPRVNLKLRVHYKKVDRIDEEKYGKRQYDCRIPIARKRHRVCRCASRPFDRTHKSSDRPFAKEYQGPQLSPWLAENGRPAPPLVGLSPSYGPGALPNGHQEAQASALTTFSPGKIHPRPWSWSDQFHRPGNANGPMRKSNFANISSAEPSNFNQHRTLPPARAPLPRF
jgi:hypothetical protein